MAEGPRSKETKRGGRSWLWLGLAVGLWFVLTLPQLSMQVWKGEGYRTSAGGFVTPQQYDQVMFHQPVIERFVSEWPVPNLRDYQSTTGPGYHLLMAGVKLITGEARTMQIVNALLGAGLVVAMWWAVLPLAGGRGAAVLALPLACSAYTVSGSVWLTTDNLSWTFVIIALGLVILRPFTEARAVGAGVACAMGVFVRQVHIWPIAPIGLVGLLASPLARPLARWIRRGDGERKWSGLVAGIMGAALPVAVLGWLVWLWGDLTPPAYRDMHDAGANPASFAFALLCFGVFGVWFMPAAWEQVKRLRLTDWTAWGCVLMGIASGLVVRTDFERMERSFGWIWEGPIRRFPDVGGRSLVVLAGAPVGALVLLLLWRRARAAGRSAEGTILLLTTLGWLCAQTLNTMAWQRYFEPMVLIVLAMLCALGGGLRDRRGYAGVVVLVALQFVYSVLRASGVG